MIERAGEDSLYWGSEYYTMGMGYTAPEDHQKRLDSFKEAERFYRCAAAQGNVVAYLCLGYVYSYDRCEGDYRGDPLASQAQKGPAQPFSREKRAFECFSVAAKAGIPEACYKLGDLYRYGEGCEPDAGEAFRWYARASELAAHEPPVILGSTALRLGECYEEGLGCPQDFSRAHDWYKQAVIGLEAAVASGEEWYEKALANARAGAKRCGQEIAFQGFD